MAPEKNRTDELKSEEVQEILSYIPHWIIRWGISVIFFTIIIILLASWFVRYPDVIQSRIIITTRNPPVSIIARSSGRLTKFVNENEVVKKGAFLGYIENAADFEDATLLMQQLEKIENLKPEEKYVSAYSLLGENLKLGDMQADYLTFLKALKDLHFFRELGFYDKQISVLQSQIQYYEKLNNSLESQSAMQNRELTLTQKKFSADSSLAKQQLIASMDLDQSEAVFLQKKQSVENANSNIIHNKIQIAECEKRITELELQYQQAQSKYVLDLDEAFKRLKNQLTIWRQQYLLETPMDGKVSFFKFRSNNEFINAGENVMSVVSGSQEMVGMVTLPVYGSGKVKTGQKVNIKFDNYPYTQYGIVRGVVTNISEVPKDNNYSIEVSLTNGLETSYRKRLGFKQEMQGSAEIITDDMRLIERIFNQLRALKEDFTK